MKKRKFALQIISFGLIIITFIACDKDFETLESDVLNSDIATNFDILSDQYDIIAYTKALEPVQTNRLGLTTLGVYEDLYGRTTSSFVSQLTPSSFNPDFGEEVVIDSVVIYIPYYSRTIGIDDDGNTTYEIDSVISKGDNYGNIKLKVFESNYFIRDFDPNADFNEGQAYFSDRSASESEMITNLEGTELTKIRANQTSYLPPSTAIDDVMEFSDEGYVLEGLDENNETEITSRPPPGLRIKLDSEFWKNKIIDREGDPVLSNQSNFANYFRGLYFKAEAYDNDGTYFILDTDSQNANITIHYTRLTPSTIDDEDETDTSTYVLRFGPNKINFLDNEFTTPLENGEPETGDSRIYLKGGEGAVAGIKLFNGDDIDDIAEMNTFEIFKNEFVETDDNGDFVSSKRLVNEANLVFYVDRNQLDLLNEDPENEPNRLYLYNVANKTPLLDYFLDVSNTTLPSFSKLSHLGLLERDESNENRGVKYKLKITEHINNLLLRDSTNVELGLGVSLNVNLEDTSLGLTQSKLKNSDDFTVPVSSVLSPRGTILFGNNTEPENESKRVYLEIYYTETN